MESNICQSFDYSDQSALQDLVNSYSNCFYVPMLIVLNVLDKIYLKRFTDSFLYKNYMSEILANSNPDTINSTSSNQTAPKPAKATELAAKPKPNDSLPSSFYSTPKTMQLGKIDSTGRFIRNFKIVPDESSEMLSRLAADDDFAMDDAWTLNTSAELRINQDFSSPSSAVNTFTSAKKIAKSKLEKLIDLIPIVGQNHHSKSSQEEREMAERMAEMLVNDVIRQNRQLVLD